MFSVALEPRREAEGGLSTSGARLRNGPASGPAAAVRGSFRVVVQSCTLSYFADCQIETSRLRTGGSLRTDRSHPAAPRPMFSWAALTAILVAPALSVSKAFLRSRAGSKAIANFDPESES